MVVFLFAWMCYSLTQARADIFSEPSKKVDKNTVIQILSRISNKILFKESEVVSRYFDEFVPELLKIKTNFKVILSYTNDNPFMFIQLSNTNIIIRSDILPLLEAIQIIHSIEKISFLDNFSNFEVLEYGEINLLKLDYKDRKASLVVFVSKNILQRIDYWINANNVEVIVWSALLGFDPVKEKKDKIFLSSVLFNFKTERFDKFDFFPIK